MSELSWIFLKNLFLDNPESAERDGYSANKVWIKNTEKFNCQPEKRISVRYLYLIAFDCRSYTFDAFELKSKWYLQRYKNCIFYETLKMMILKSNEKSLYHCRSRTLHSLNFRLSFSFASTSFYLNSKRIQNI